MNKSYELSLSDSLRDHLEDVLEQKKSESIDAEKTIKASKALLDKLQDQNNSEQVEDSIDKLKCLIEMVEDPMWDMRENNRNYVMAVLSYFSGSKQYIPNFMPELGVLFDAMMIDLVAEKLTHERDAYNDFKNFVKAYKKSPFFKGKGIELTKDDWVKARKKELRDRLKRRRRRDARKTGLRGSNFTVI